MATWRPDLSGTMPTPAKLQPTGPLMTLREMAALALAPRRPQGTLVSVQARPVGPDWELPLPAGRVAAGPDHMFVGFDDGRNPLIARGGPSMSGLGFLTGSIDGSNRMSARVDPAPQSPDDRTGYRTLAQRFLPGVTAEQAAAAARRHAQGVNRGGNDYGLTTNSNSYAADVAEPIFGWRPGDGLTPGYRAHLRDTLPPDLPLDPNALAPVLRDPLS